MQIIAGCITICFKKSGFIIENLHEELDNTDLKNQMIVAEQLVNSLLNYMQGEDFFSIDQNLDTEEDSCDIKLFITRNNDKE